MKFFLGRSKAIDSTITNNKKIEIDPLDLVPTIRMQTKRCEAVFNEYAKTMTTDDISDEKLRKFCRFTDGLPLWNFRNALHLVPGLVNVVSVNDLGLRKNTFPLYRIVFPLRSWQTQFRFVDLRSRSTLERLRGASTEPSTSRLGGSPPYNWHSINQEAGRCSSTRAESSGPVSRLEPQLPLPRIIIIPFPLLGTNGPQAARLAVARAIHAIATQAGVHIGIRRFSVINQVHSRRLHVLSPPHI